MKCTNLPAQYVFINFINLSVGGLPEAPPTGFGWTAEKYVTMYIGVMTIWLGGVLKDLALV